MTASDNNQKLDEKNLLKKFSSEVIDQLNNYVYRLIDPRNGETFYVGRGVGNRLSQYRTKSLKRIEGEGLMEISTNQSSPHESD
ncbi:MULTISPECIES: hypothetical protein [Cyanophyceae]|uniref:hypothetical protein n=1 Tax=Cyanophyceae TaxID=3028117 RepID=UPI00059EBF43|nr:MULTISPECIES: hypothetical protein [Cyanophyceae]SMH47677.1 hypothetical protein SAMN06272755_1813 [Picosynechococcus sp. OG1]SMQ81065.1 hypothetical protein SAMN06272774_1092 [Synechococcus sp. 7002]